MNLDHLLAADTFGAALDDGALERLSAVLRAFGFQREGTTWSLDPQFPYVTLEPHEGAVYVHVDRKTPAHLWTTAAAALEGTVREARLFRVDALHRSHVDEFEWARRVEAFEAALPSGRR